MSKYTQIIAVKGGLAHLWSSKEENGVCIVQSLLGWKKNFKEPLNLFPLHLIWRNTITIPKASLILLDPIFQHFAHYAMV